MNFFIRIFFVVSVCLAFAGNGMAMTKDDARTMLKRSQKLLLSNPDSTIILARMVIARAAAQGQDSLEYSAKMTLCKAWLHTGKLDSAESMARNCLAHYREKKDNSGIGSAMMRLGKIYGNRGEFDDALVYLFDGIEFLKQAGDSSQLAYGLNMIGSTYYSLPDFDKAEQFFGEAGALFEILGNSHGQASIVTNLGNIALQKGDLEKAKKNYESSIVIKKELGDLSGLGDAYNNLSAVYYFQKNYPEASKAILQSMEYRKQINYQYGIAECYLNLGEIYFLDNKPEEGIKSVKKCVEVAEKADVRELLEAGLGSLVNMYRERNLDSALFYMDSLRVVEKALLAHRQTKKSSELEAKYQNEQKALEIEYLKQKNELSKDNEEKSRRIGNILLMGLIGLGLFTIILVAVLLRLRRLNQSLNENIATRIESEEKLREINEKLQSMIYRSSHDIKSPLNSVKGLIGLMRTENDPAQSRQFLEMIDRKLDQLHEFVAGLLAIGQVDNQALQEKWVMISVTTDSVMDSLENMKGFSEVNIINKLNPDEKIYTDETIIRSSIQNLISNAIKYRNLESSDSYCEISSKTEGNVYHLMVKDNGIGIEANHLDKLFDKFSRFSVQSEGTGIGLHLVKKSIEKIGGVLSVKSTPGSGSTFTLSLPLKQAN